MNLPLFDEPSDDLWIADSDWKEAPQEVYLSWPEAQQLAYQAARDRDSAVYENDQELKLFFIRRSQTWNVSTR